MAGAPNARKEFAPCGSGVAAWRAQRLHSDFAGGELFLEAFVGGGYARADVVFGLPPERAEQGRVAEFARGAVGL